jgi:hypothetical protein
MKSLDDLLAKKKGEREAIAQQEKDSQEQAAQEQRQSDITSLEKAKKQLSIIKNSLSLEKGGRVSATERDQTAQDTFEQKAKELEEYDITKEQLLTEYAELDEIQELEAAREEKDVFSIESVQSEKLQSTLESLGVEVPPGSTEEKVVALIEKRLESINSELSEKQLEAPNGKEAVITSILEENDLLSDQSLQSLNTIYYGRGGAKFIGSGVQDASNHFINTLSKIPALRGNTELRNAVMERLATEVILRGERDKAAQAAADRAAYEEGIQSRGWQRSNSVPRTDYERYQAAKDNIAGFTADATEKGIDINGSSPESIRLRENIASNQQYIDGYEARISAPGKMLTEYASVSEARSSIPYTNPEDSSRGLTSQMEALTAATTKLIAYPEDLVVKFNEQATKGGFYLSEVSFLIPSGLERVETIGNERRRLTNEIEALEAEQRELGDKPTGMFSGKKQQEWEAKQVSFKTEIAQRNEQRRVLLEEVHGIETNLSFGRLGPDVIDQLSANPQMTVGQLKEFFKEKVQEKQIAIPERKAIEEQEDRTRSRFEELNRASILFKSN